MPDQGETILRYGMSLEIRKMLLGILLWLLACVALGSTLFLRPFDHTTGGIKAPLIDLRWAYEPLYIVGLRFNRRSEFVIAQGYRKVLF